MTIKKNGLTLKIEYDSNPINPRKELDNLGKIFAWHKRYNLGDENPYPLPSDFHNDKKLQDDIFVSLPVYMYDHSGIAISTVPFSCKWDSGQLGVIVATKTAVMKEFGDLSEKTKCKVVDMLKNEIKEHSSCLSDDHYVYSIMGLDGELLDCIGGFSGNSFYDVLKQMRETASSDYSFLFDKMLSNTQTQSYDM